MIKFYHSLFISLACIFLSATSISAATAYKSLLINYTDGTSLLLAIENGMTTEFDNGDIVMKSSKGTIAAPTADIKSINFSTIPGEDWGTAGIGAIPSETISVAVNSSSVEIQNIPGTSLITMTNLAGQTVKSLQATDSASISTGSLPKGIYILTIDNKAIKIAIK